MHLHFSLAFVEFLARHRTPLLTDFFLACSFFGRAGFYVFLVMLLYVTWEKRLAVRLSLLVLLTMAANDLLKNLIRNPRPFVDEGIWRQNWAVSAAQARSLAAEFSTPSGHAMGSASFYGYLAGFAHRRSVRILCALAILLIGFSRPYLGVHYGEDVLLGWAIGLFIAFAAARSTHGLTALWNRCPYPAQIAAAVFASALFCYLSVALNGGTINGQLHGMASYAGFLTGNIVAFPLEGRYVCFDPRSGSGTAKMTRLILTLAVIGGTVAVLGPTFALLAWQGSIAWLVLEYLRFTMAGIAGMFVAPWLFTRLGMASILPED